MSTEERTPLSALGAIPTDAPTLIVNDAEVPHYSLNWENEAGRRTLNSDGTMPTHEVVVNGERLELLLSAPEQPLSLSVMVFNGSLATVDPTGAPVQATNVQPSATAIPCDFRYHCRGFPPMSWCRSSPSITATLSFTLKRERRTSLAGRLECGEPGNPHRKSGSWGFPFLRGGIPQFRAR